MNQRLSELPVKDGFRLRGESISRLENFVDAAFAFAVTLLVISSGVPTSMDELVFALHRIPTLVVCFLVMMMFWAGHDRWSRRFGLDDAWTTTLSLLLVLGVLVFVYPQRIIMSAALNFMTRGWVPRDVDMQSFDQMRSCFIVYSLGFGFLSALLVLLDRHALLKADELQLDAIERIEARRDLGSHLIFLGSAVLSIVLALVARSSSSLVASLPGFAYMLIGPAMHFHHARMHRLRATLTPRETA